MEDGICNDETPSDEDARLDPVADALKAAAEERVVVLEGRVLETNSGRL